MQFAPWNISARFARFASATAVACLMNSTSASEVQEYNIYAVPSPDIVQLVANFGEQMKQHDLHSFHARGYLPHATLYLTSFTADKVEQVKQVVAEMAQGKKPFALDISGTHLTGGRWFFIDIVPNVKLQALADEMAATLSPLRNPAYEAPAWTACCPAKQATFAKYGSPNVFDQYNPHLTQLAAEKSPKLDEFIASIATAPPAAKGWVIGIGFAPADALGQIKQGDETVYLFSGASEVAPRD